MDYPILAALAKVVIVLGFLLTAAAVLTWAERRQSAMIQDRVGPNRAVIHLPGWLVRSFVAVVGVALAALVVVDGYVVGYREPMLLDERIVLLELAVAATWIGAVIARRAKDTRPILWLGLFGHVLVLVGWLFTHPEATGRDRVDPDSALLAIMKVAGSVGPAWLALSLLTAAYFAIRCTPHGKVGVRLAGLLHLVADTAKMAFKEDFVPPRADRLLHALGPIVALFPVLVTFAVVPFGDTLCWSAAEAVSVMARNRVCSEGGVPLQIADLNVGILFLFALAGTGVVGAAIAGWSSDNKFSLLGGLRASSQMIGYEVAIGLTLVGAFMIYETVRLGDMVRWQSEHAWGIFVQPFAFVLFLTASVAEQKRTPFDAPEGESEIVAGYFVEYSGLKWAMFYVGEYIEVVVSSAILATIFFGGWAVPFVHRDGITVAFGDSLLWYWPLQHWGVIAIGVVAFFGKVLFICWAQLFIRWTVPRFRYDQIMAVGWRILLPGALLNIVATGGVVLALDAGGAAVSEVLGVLGDITQAIVLVGAVVLAIAFVSSWLAPAKGRDRVASSSADLSRVAGGTRTSPMQA